MGIQGLLPLLKSIQTPMNIKDYSGQTLAIDGYCWLHKGAFSCAVDLGLGRPTTKHIDFCIERIRFLKSHGVIPFVVLDGGYLPMKKHIEVEREAKRAESIAMGKKLLAEGNSKKAYEYFQTSVDITPEMAYLFIQALKRMNVKYVVAPYEADAQLAFLDKEGIVDGVITEDSDLIVYGCKKLLYKMERNGDLIEINTSKLASVTSLDFRGWNLEKFRAMCILSGCDYLKSLPGIGLKTAYKLLKKYGDAEKALRNMQLNNKLCLPSDYMDNFEQAELTFRHQRVFDPATKQAVYLHPADETIFSKHGGDEFLGKHIDSDQAVQIATGDWNPITNKAIEISHQQLIKSGLLAAGSKNIMLISGEECEEENSQSFSNRVQAKAVSLGKKVVEKKSYLTGTMSKFFPTLMVKEDPAAPKSSNENLLISSTAPARYAAHEEFVDVLDEEEDKNTSKSQESTFITASSTSTDTFHRILKKFKYSRTESKPTVVQVTPFNEDNDVIIIRSPEQAPPINMSKPKHTAGLGKPRTSLLKNFSFNTQTSKTLKQARR